MIKNRGWSNDGPVSVLPRAAADVGLRRVDDAHRAEPGRDRRHARCELSRQRREGLGRVDEIRQRARFEGGRAVRVVSHCTTDRPARLKNGSVGAILHRGCFVRGLGWNMATAGGEGAGKDAPAAP